MNKPHISVLQSEVLKGLNVQKDQWYIDATLGAGGHTQRILEMGGKVLGIDQDDQALELVKNTIHSPSLRLIKGNFATLRQLTAQAGVDQVAGILFDLGVSSMQLDTPERGFSFMVSAPLDMRMDKSLTVTAKDLVNALGPKELTLLFTKYSQESRARAIAQAIVNARHIKPIETTTDLANIILRVYGGRTGKIHPATKVFQALRMAVNDEINSLNEALEATSDLLLPQGRLAVISFHEGEDRIVKNFIKEKESQNLFKNLTDKPITPSDTELIENPRSRSAKLRLAEKIYV